MAGSDLFTRSDPRDDRLFYAVERKVVHTNPCSPTKAVRAWLVGGDFDHVALVRAHLANAGFDAIADEVPPTPDDPLLVVSGRA